MTDYPRGHPAKYFIKLDLAMLQGAMVDLALLSMQFQSSYGFSSVVQYSLEVFHIEFALNNPLVMSICCIKQ
jgi:hypothetical protein